jgi:hypothetical protein
MAALKRCSFVLALSKEQAIDSQQEEKSNP